MKDLRNSNIVMGNDKLTYKTESKSLSHTSKQTNLNTAGVSMSKGEDARASHLDFCRRGQGEYTTNYNSAFNSDKGPQGNVFNLKELKKDLTQNHFKLGYHELDTFTTENKDQFKHQDAKFQGIVKGNRQGSFKLSYDKNNE